MNKKEHSRPGIYKITAPNGKIYIGQSRNCYQRSIQYTSKYSQLKHRLIGGSIKEFGWQVHKFEIIHELPFDVDSSILNVYEELYINQYRECGFEMLNLRDGGVNGKHSYLSIDKMKGNNGMHMVGRKLSVDSIAKRTEKQKGMKRSEESKLKYRNSKLGSNNPQFGKPAWNKGIPGSTRKKC